MSTVAGIAAGDKTFLAADQQLTDENSYVSYEGGKIFRKGHLIIGVAGDAKAMTAFPWLPTSKFKYESEPRRFMTLTFPRLLNEFIDQYEVLLGEYELLVGTKGMLFQYSSDNESVSPVGLYYAIGSGGPFALGSLATTERSASVTRRLRSAVQIGIRFDAYSGGEVEVLSQ